MPDVLLIQPPIRDFYLTSKRTIPYGLACMASALLKHGFSVQIFDALATSRSRQIDWPKEMAYLRRYYGDPDASPFALFHAYRHFGYSFEHIGKIARDAGAFLVGISSLFTPYIEEAVKTAETVKTFHPHCKIVLGGHHPTMLPLPVMENPSIDFVLRGEGEVSLPLLARAVKEGGNLHAIPGIVYRNHQKEIFTREPAGIDDLDECPPAMDLISHSFYKRHGKGSTAIVASRGCPMKCTYCAVGANAFLPYRRRSIHGIMDEMAHAITRFHVRFIDFEDENLSLKPEWFLALLHEITERFGTFGIELRAMNGLISNTLDETMIRAMKKAGFKVLNLSLGSTSKNQLKRFQRPDTTEAFERALALAETYDLAAVGYVIIGGPFQDARESLNDLLFLARNRVLAGVSVYYPAPGSADYRICQTRALLPETFSLMRSSAFPLSHTTSRDESATLLRLGRIINFMKTLIDRNLEIPVPAAPKERIENPADRMTTGIQLLQWFLWDGNIRGVRPDGQVYDHHCSPDLTRTFVENLARIRLRGFTRRNLP